MRSTFTALTYLSPLKISTPPFACAVFRDILDCSCLLPKMALKIKRKCQRRCRQLVHTWNTA